MTHTIDKTLDHAIKAAVAETVAKFEHVLVAANRSIGALENKNQELLSEKKKLQGKGPVIIDRADPRSRDSSYYRNMKALAEERGVPLQFIDSSIVDETGVGNE
jgi:hypothetical protein